VIRQRQLFPANSFGDRNHDSDGDTNKDQIRQPAAGKNSRTAFENARNEKGKGDDNKATATRIAASAASRCLVSVYGTGAA
jgi:hypothetical protein